MNFRNKKKLLIILPILLVVFVIAFLFISKNHIPNNPKWVIPKWIQKYDVKINTVTYTYSDNSKNNSSSKSKNINSNKYYNLVNTLDNIINKRVRFERTISKEQLIEYSNKDFYNNYNYMINIDYSNNAEVYGNTGIALYKTADCYIIMYLYYLNTEEVGDFIFKEISKSDFEEILSYCN